MIDITRGKALCADIPVPHYLGTGLGVLFQASQYARDVSRDPWEFAVEIDELRSLGMTNADIRWLLCKGLLEHARELPCHQRDRRQFIPGSTLTFRKRTCCVLTEQGIKVAAEMFDEESLDFGRGANGIAFPQLSESVTKPRWDGERHQFFVDNRLVKEFKVPSPNQETILTAFEEESWPIRIDDPLTATPQVDPKRRLHDTIKSLNRNQKRNLIRFLGDGTGEGVRWEFNSLDESGSAGGR